MNPYYTIIIPHFNIPQLLRRLLMSIPQRDDVQVIVVDDCSTKHLDELVALRKEFNAVEWYDTGTNGGGGKARNIGLHHAKGKYVLFADSDDYFDSNLVEIMNQYKNTDADLIYFPISGEEDCPSLRVRQYNEIFTEYQSEPQKGLFKLRYEYLCPWGKLIRLHLINSHNINFEESIIHNDVMFSAKIGIYAEKILVSEKAIYVLTEREKSVSKVLSDKQYFSRLRTYAQLNKIYNRYGVDRFDKMIFSPISHYVKIWKFKKAYKCFKILHEYDYSLHELVINFF